MLIQASQAILLQWLLYTKIQITNQIDHRYCHDWGINGEKLTLVNADVIHIDQRALFSLPLSYRAIQTDVGEKRSDFKGSALSIVTEKLDIY